ncbi:MAG: hypothetical protein J6Y19_11420 [Kiritimatiellae bacterium]|nr:hypothetical protein [Kiritimatiellia bacterium]
MNREIYEEIMAPRRCLWEKGGGTLHGVCEYLRRHRAERLARQAAEVPPNHQTTKLSNGDSDLARKGAEGDAR